MKPNSFQRIVRVHRRGQNPERDAKPEVATEGPDGRLWVRSRHGDWWCLSLGLAGWHSMNFGLVRGIPENDGIIRALDRRETESV